jgi:uroporphyrinogen decarboxylase
MDAIALDWRVSMKQARAVVGPDTVLCGNVDPITLYGTDEQIRRSARQCMIDAGELTVGPLVHLLCLYRT